MRLLFCLWLVIVQRGPDMSSAVHGNCTADSNIYDCVSDYQQEPGATRQIASGLAVPVGEGLNVFHRYGFLSFSINVAPLSLNDTKLFRETTLGVLQRNDYLIDVRRYSRNSVDRHIQMHLCDSIDSLLSSYLQKFTIEGLQKPWKAFTASWRRQLLPRMLGVPAAYLTDDYRFLMVRVEKHSVVGSLGGNAILDESLLQRIAEMNPGTLRQAVDFFLDHGTHIISKYITGDAIYQVLVYTPTTFQQLREKLQDFDINSATRASMTNLFATYPSHVGKLQVVSGNRTLIQWLETRLAVSSLPKTLPSSVRLLAAPALLNHVYRQLQERAVLGMQLDAMTRAIPETHKRSWLNDVLHNLLRIWEFNM